MKVKSNWLGRISYSQGLVAQAEAIENSIHNPVSLLGLEHDPVITMGKRAGPIDLSLAEEELKAEGFELFYTDRGGQATIHNPGQLVIYPICKLKTLNMGVRDFVEYLLETTRLVLKDYHINSASEGGIGLYTEHGKIAFVGLRIRKGISCHGIAININNELNDFKFIRSCGISKAKHDSLKNRGIDASTLNIFQLWSERFEDGLT